MDKFCRDVDLKPPLIRQLFYFFDKPRDDLKFLRVFFVELFFKEKKVLFCPFHYWNRHLYIIFLKRLMIIAYH